MDPKKDRAQVFFPPPLVFFILLAIGAGLEYFVPARPQAWPWGPRIVGAGFFLVLSGFLAAAAFIVLIKNRTPFDPAKPTTKIVISGPFRFSRNPMYLSLLLSMAGGAVLSCSLWIASMVTILWVILELWAVRPEG